MSRHPDGCMCRACRIRRNWRDDSPWLDALVMLAIVTFGVFMASLLGAFG